MILLYKGAGIYLKYNGDFINVKGLATMDGDVIKGTRLIVFDNKSVGYGYLSYISTKDFNNKYIDRDYKSGKNKTIERYTKLNIIQNIMYYIGLGFLIKPSIYQGE